jgi:hypothetical protein
MRAPAISFKGLQKPGNYAAVQIVTILATITAVTLVIFKKYYASQFGGQATPQLIQWIGIGAASATGTALILTHLFWKRAASAEPKKNEPTPPQPKPQRPKFTPATDGKPPHLLRARYGTPSEFIRPTLPTEHKYAPAIATQLAYLDKHFEMIQTDPDVSHAVAFLSSLYIKLLESPENGRLEIKKWIRLFPSPHHTHQKAIREALQRLLVSPSHVVHDKEALKSLNLYLKGTHALSDITVFGINAYKSRPRILVINSASARLMTPDLPQEDLDPANLCPATVPELVCFYDGKKYAALIPKDWMKAIFTQKIPETFAEEELAQEESAHSPLLDIESPSTNETVPYTRLAIEAPPTVKVETLSPAADYLVQEYERTPLSTIPEGDEERVIPAISVEEGEEPAAVPLTEAVVQEKPKTPSLSLDYASPLKLAQKWYTDGEMLVVGEQMRYLALHFEMVEVDSKKKALVISLMHFYQTNPDEAKKLLPPELVELLKQGDHDALESMHLELMIPFKYVKSTAFAYNSAIPRALQVSPLRRMEQEGKVMSSFLPEAGSFLVIFERTKESYSVLIPKMQEN